MARNPVTRQFSWLMVLPLFTIFGALSAVGFVLGGSTGQLIALGGVILYILAVRKVLTRHQLAGVREVRKLRFVEAIPHFQQSFEFFSRHQWLDDWRCLTLFTASRVSYREMSLLNRAFCYGQIDEGILAMQTYEQCLALFPDSGRAQAALRLMASARQVEASAVPPAGE